MFFQQQATPPLEGRWKFSHLEQVIYSASGEILEIIKQDQSQTSYRFLDITHEELIYHHEQIIGTQVKVQLVKRRYTRKGDSLLVIPYPGVKPISQNITSLSDKFLIIKSINNRRANNPYTEFIMHFVK